AARAWRSRRLVLLGIAAGALVVAVAAGIEHQPHQAAADRQRRDHAQAQGDVALRADLGVADLAPGPDADRAGADQERHQDDRQDHGLLHGGLALVYPRAGNGGSAGSLPGSAMLRHSRQEAESLMRSPRFVRRFGLTLAVLLAAL